MILPSMHRKNLKIDRPIQYQVKKYIEKLLSSKDPLIFGKPLRGLLKNVWSFRIGDYRMLCTINQNQLTILALDIAHRCEVYKH